MYQKSNGKQSEKKPEEKNQDRLTGVLKKDIAEERITSKMRGKRGGTLFLCDIDNMKQINKQYGHLAGDECLKQTAQILSYMIRSDDVLGRCGGDEFVIFVSDCQDARQAQEICRRFQNRFRGNGGKEKGKLPLSVTIVWVLRKPGDTFPKMFARAGEELDRQKAVSDMTEGQDEKRSDLYIKDVRQVRKELMEQIQTPGAYCQDYQTFKSIYRFLERGIIRSGQKACIILITVVDEQGENHLLHEKDMLMEQLGKNIETTLRIGDVYTRYSSSQYLLLVINTTEGQVDRIVERIKNQFLAGRQGKDVLVHHCYQLQPAQIGKII